MSMLFYGDDDYYDDSYDDDEGDYGGDDNGGGVASTHFQYQVPSSKWHWEDVHQVLHRPQNKEKPMQNNFDSPVRVTQNDFRV